jgi:pentapeptide repeat protein
MRALRRATAAGVLGGVVPVPVTAGAAAQTIKGCNIGLGTNCPASELVGANLPGANLTGADLRMTSLRRAIGAAGKQ